MSDEEDIDEDEEQPLPAVKSFHREEGKSDRKSLSKFKSSDEKMNEDEEQPLPGVQSFQKEDDKNDRKPLSKLQSFKEDVDQYEEQPLLGVQSFQREERKNAKFQSSKEDMSEDEEQPLQMKKMNTTTKPSYEVIEDNPEELERCGVVYVKEKRAKMKAKPPLNMQRRTRLVAEKKRSQSANLQMFSILVENCLGDECTISHGAEIFGFETKSVFNKDGCRLVINFEEVTNSIIEIWARYLHEKMVNEGGEILVQFGTSAAVRIPKKPSVQSVTKRSQYIADLLGIALLGQITLIPYNTGAHWVLAAIDMAMQTVYYLDSIEGSPSEDLEGIVNQGVRIHHASTSKNRMNLKWVRVMCPKQAGAMECGYFVMKYMKDIASDVKLLKQNFSKIKEYTEGDILGIREECATYAATLITMMMKAPAMKT
ncbi:unnamed protein product [Cuscuta europaea]|uniref:Ubiquitin-like protease family profile domain-containing protein n=1 Tax=Cuscuta europaea TaxID=41803 RepID=A0A9P1E215_CUSEU|nr:unnamed protein product [Cuscuta europaea]